MLILHVNSLSPSLPFFLLPYQITLSHIFDTTCIALLSSQSDQVSFSRASFAAFLPK